VRGRNETPFHGKAEGYLRTAVLVILFMDTNIACPTTASRAAFFGLFAPPALILLPEHEFCSTSGTMPGVVAEEWIDAKLQKTLECNPPEGMSALLTEHFRLPCNNFRHSADASHFLRFCYDDFAQNSLAPANRLRKS